MKSGWHMFGLNSGNMLMFMTRVALGTVTAIATARAMGVAI